MEGPAHVQEKTSLEMLMSLMAPRCKAEDLENIQRAYTLAREAHGDQKRSSGEPYITHPLQVAMMLAELNLDPPTVIAALLHDVVEDTSVSLDEVQKQFGAEIAGMVDAVTKISKRETIAQGESETFNYRTEREAESLRKMLLGMANDVRVVLIKLADRLHNMQTLGSLPPDRQRRIARETLEIYAPLANRLGIREWKRQLEDLGLRYAEPEAYAYIARLLQENQEEREARIKRYVEQLRAALAQAGITDVEVTGRAKQIYSIWEKMHRKNVPFDRIQDTEGIRVIIEETEEEMQLYRALGGQKEEPIKLGNPSNQNNREPPSSQLGSKQVGQNGRGDNEQQGEQDQPSSTTTVADREPQVAPPSIQVPDSLHERQKLLLRMRSVQMCYTVMGIVHTLWKFTGSLSDYINVPKDNMYRSLHTSVCPEEGKWLEVQIRTRSMHQAAEYGIAAHWLYKDKGAIEADYRERIERLRESIQTLSSGTQDATEFIQALKTDQLSDRVYCFTPKGKLIDLPVGATVLDFAYRIHTEIGHHCRGAKVNGRLVPLTYQLQNNDLVEILTRPDATPSRDWLLNEAYVATSHARSKIRQWFRKLDRSENIKAGRELLERCMKQAGVAGVWTIAEVLKLFRIEEDKAEVFYERLGCGELSQQSIMARLLEERRRQEREKQQQKAQPQDKTANAAHKQKLPPSETKLKGYFALANLPSVVCEPAKCCNPQPHDDVIGLVVTLPNSGARGVKVHRRDCKALIGKDERRFVKVIFVADRPSELLEVKLQLTCVNRIGLVADITRLLSDHNINIRDFGMNTGKNENIVKLWFKVQAENADQLAQVVSRCEQVNSVLEAGYVFA